MWIEKRRGLGVNPDKHQRFRNKQRSLNLQWRKGKLIIQCVGEKPGVYSVTESKGREAFKKK